MNFGTNWIQLETNFKTIADNKVSIFNLMLSIPLFKDNTVALHDSLRSYTGVYKPKEPRSGQSANALTRHRARPCAPLSGSPQGVHIAPSVSLLPCVIIFKLQRRKIRSLLRIVLTIGVFAKLCILFVLCTVLYPVLKIKIFFARWFYKRPNRYCV